MSWPAVQTSRGLGQCRLWPLLVILSIGVQHVSARLPSSAPAPAPPRQQLETPYSNEASNESEQKRVNLKELLTYQLQRAADERSSNTKNAFVRRPALVAPRPSQLPNQYNSAVRLSRPRYAGNQLLTDTALDNSNESASESTEIENEVTEVNGDADAGYEEDSQEADVTQESEEEHYDPYRDNFYDLNADGSYIFGYSLPNGVRRYERSIKSKRTHGLLVEGFYTQPRHLPHGLFYELRCYRSDANGHRPFPVEFLKRPPRVQRDEEPDVDCLRH